VFGVSDGRNVKTIGANHLSDCTRAGRLVSVIDGGALVVIPRAVVTSCVQDPRRSAVQRVTGLPDCGAGLGRNL